MSIQWWDSRLTQWDFKDTYWTSDDFVGLGRPSSRQRWIRSLGDNNRDESEAEGQQRLY